MQTFISLSRNKTGGRDFLMEEMIQRIADRELRAQVERVASFHGYLSTGAFAGIQMLNLARRVLDVSKEERLFVACETYNCLPDPFQVLAGCAIGNRGLKIRDYGKMAVTVSLRGPPGGLVKAVRIVLDVPEKPRKIIGLCEGCGESFISQDDDLLCQACLDASALESLTSSTNSLAEDLKCPQS